MQNGGFYNKYNVGTGSGISVKQLGIRWWKLDQEGWVILIRYMLVEVKSKKIWILSALFHLNIV